MAAVGVIIVGYVDDHQPGWVECRLADVEGREWSFVEKVPVVSLEPLTSASVYPQVGEIACEVVARSVEFSGREIVEIDTSRPWSIESVDGFSRFKVYAAQLVAS